mgnify:CR=1 FL=1
MTYAEQARRRPAGPTRTARSAWRSSRRATGRPGGGRSPGPHGRADDGAATYLDRFFAGVALALAEAQLGKGQDTLGALEALDASSRRSTMRPSRCWPSWRSARPSPSSATSRAQGGAGRGRSSR